MNNKAILIHADGIEEPMVPANGTDFDLDELQKAVGGLIEIINLRGDERILVINEEGKFMSLDESRLMKMSRPQHWPMSSKQYFRMTLLSATWLCATQTW